MVMTKQQAFRLDSQRRQHILTACGAGTAVAGIVVLQLLPSLIHDVLK